MKVHTEKGVKQKNIRKSYLYGHVVIFKTSVEGIQKL